MSRSVGSGLVIYQWVTVAFQVDDLAVHSVHIVENVVQIIERRLISGLGGEID